MAKQTLATNHNKHNKQEGHNTMAHQTKPQRPSSVANLSEDSTRVVQAIIWLNFEERRKAGQFKASNMRVLTSNQRDDHRWPLLNMLDEISTSILGLTLVEYLTMDIGA